MSHLQDVLYGLKWNDLPEATQHQARRCLMDLVGVFASGTQTPMSRISTEHASMFYCSPDRPVRLLGDGRMASAPGVAMAGAFTIDSIDAHDGMKLTKGHAGSIVLPSLIALLEMSGGDYDDEEFMTCLVLGYEIAIRDGISLHASVPDYHTSGAWVAVAVAALGARILGLDRAQMEEAVGIAEYSGPRSQMMRAIDHPTMVKDGAGWGAMAGVSAALLAEQGFTGAPAVTITNPDLSQYWSDLGSTWHIVNQYIKPWPVCRWAQPAATAVIDVMKENNLGHEHIEKISVFSFHEAIRLSTRIPRDTEEAQYSLPWPVAAAAVRRRIEAAEISAPFDDPRIIELANGMELHEDNYCNEVFPGERLARVTITAPDGTAHSSEITRATWDPESPPTDAEMTDKFHGLTDPVIGLKAAKSLNKLIWSMGEGGSARALVDRLSENFHNQDMKN
jgi:2-methylcitrate dehydratase PrpD